MQWYWWVLVIVGVVALGALKLKVWNGIKANRSGKNDKDHPEED